MESGTIRWEEVAAGIDPSWIASARWYRRKSEGVRSVRLLDAALLPSPGPALNVLLLVDVEAGDGALDTYFLPACLMQEEASLGGERMGRGGGFFIREALGDIRFQSVFHSRFGEQAGLRGLRGVFRFERFASRGLRQSRTLAVSSSNSLVLVKGDEVVKYLRRAEEGISPELEMNRFFACHGDFTNLPELTGALCYQADGKGTLTLALVQRFVENEGDLWFWTQDFLTDMVQEAREGTGAFPVREYAASYLQATERLAGVLAHMHRTLASGEGGDAFVPEPVTRDDLETWARAMQEGTRSVFDRVAALPPSSHPAVRRLVGELPDLRSRVDAVWTTLAGLKTERLVKCRVHGDFHLGQALRVGNDFFIMDFEGEPLKTRRQRCAKYSPFKDVAGLCRSWNYAAYAALFSLGTLSPALSGRMETILLEWNRAVENTFLAAYHEAMGIPRIGNAGRLLAVLKLEKAVYELDYEINNRPDWLVIPASGIGACLEEIDRSSL